MIQDDAFLSCITVANLVYLKAQHRIARKHYTLQTSSAHIVNTKERFFEAVNRSLPLDPPNISHNWDALDDSLFGGLLSLGSPKVDILWPFANDVAIAFLIKGVKFFKVVADRVCVQADDDPTDGIPITVRLLLVCSNEQSKQRLESEFWFLT